MLLDKYVCNFVHCILLTYCILFCISFNDPLMLCAALLDPSLILFECGVLPYGHARRYCRSKWRGRVGCCLALPTPASIKASNTHYAITGPIYSCPPHNEVWDFDWMNPFSQSCIRFANKFDNLGGKRMHWSIWQYSHFRCGFKNQPVVRQGHFQTTKISCTDFLLWDKHCHFWSPLAYLWSNLQSSWGSDLNGVNKWPFGEQRFVRAAGKLRGTI